MLIAVVVGLFILYRFISVSLHKERGLIIGLFAPLRLLLDVPVLFAGGLFFAVAHYLGSLETPRSMSQIAASALMGFWGGFMLGVQIMVFINIPVSAVAWIFDFVLGWFDWWNRLNNFCDAGVGTFGGILGASIAAEFQKNA